MSNGTDNNTKLLTDIRNTTAVKNRKPASFSYSIRWRLVVQRELNAASDQAYYAIVINSIGTATLGSAAAVAKGLGITAAQVVNCLYKAPAILVDKVEQQLATQLTRLLTDIGYDAKVVAQDELSKQASPPLFDIAVYLKDAQQFAAAVKKISGFIGLGEEDASRMLLSPPGVVLGSVSQASVDAFKRYVGDLVDIIAAPQTDARYDLFLGECADIVKNRLLEDLQKNNVMILAQSGLIASGLDSQQINIIWNRHKTNSNLRVVNQAFLRFDLVLQPLSSPLTSTQIRFLNQLAEIPEEYIADVVASAPVTLLESVSAKKTADCLETFHSIGLEVNAELISFQTLGLRIVDAIDINRLNLVLKSFNLDHPFRRPPEELPFRFPEIQARLIRAALENTGARIEFIKG
jgi:hypothetical protein